MKAKNILVTGSTVGIGKLAAINLAKEGHHIYLHGRNADKLSATISEIKELSKNLNVKGFEADFSNLTAVAQMAKKISSELPKLDVIINNAGIFKSQHSQTKDGFDIRIAVNYLAPYVLTNMLLPLLKKGENPRVVNLSSAAQAPVNENVLRGKEQVSEQEAYAQSKLALTMWGFRLAEHEPEIQIIAVNPGSLLNTKMAQEAYGQHWAPAEKGANILFDLALSDDYNGITGKYFDNDKGDVKGVFSEAYPDAYDPTKIASLISVTEDIISNMSL